MTMNYKNSEFGADTACGMPAPSAEKIIKDFIEGYRNQDNLGTAFPYYFVIRDVEWEASYHDGEFDRLALVDKDHQSLGYFDSYTELGIYLKDNPDGIEFPEEAYNENLEDERFYHLEDIYDAEEICKDLEVSLFYQKRRHENKGFFLRSEDARRHLKSNHYHYSSDAIVYCCHVWRSPEFEGFLKAVGELVGESWTPERKGE